MEHLRASDPASTGSGDEAASLGRWLAVLARCRRLLVRATDEAALQDAVCRTLVEAGGHRAAWIAVPVGDTAGTLRVVAVAGTDRDGLPSSDAPRAAIRSGAPVVAADVAAFPMTDAARSLGVLAVAPGATEGLDARATALLEDLAGDLAHAVSALRAEAGRRWAEETLAESESRYRRLFEQALRPMWIYDVETLAFVAVNDAAVRQYGYTRDEFLRMTILDIRPPEDVRVILDSVPQRSGEPHQGVWRHRRRDGTVIDVEVRSHAVPFWGPTARLVEATDVTERHRADEQRRLLSAAAEVAADGIVITDRAGRIEWVNAAFTRMTGWARDEAVGRTPRILKSGRHPPDFYQQLWRTILAGRTWRGEMTNRRRDGTLYDEEQTITPVMAPGGAVTHFVAIKQDVTERRRAAEALRRSEEKYRALIENALDMVAVLGADWTFQYASPSFERVLGYRPADLLGRDVFQFVHPDDVADVRTEALTLRDAPGAVASAEYRVRQAGGGYLVLETIASNLLHHPAVGGIIVNSRDVTERRRAEEEQARLRAHLGQSEKLAAMGELLAGVAHELNNPLSVVIGHTELLRRSGEAASRAEKIEQAARRCARIVKNFLALARQHPARRERVDLNHTVRDTAELLAYPLRVDGVVVTLDLASDVPVLWADSHQLQQVVLNLLTNAHHAVRQSAEPRRLTVTTRFLAGAGAVRLEVLDSGPGIPPEVERRIFEPFFTTKPVGQGTGLGLSICKGIVEAHGGRIEVEGRPGRGARFRIELPVGAPAPAAEAAAPAAPAAGRTVLVVDDEPEVAGVLAEMCAGDGHRVDRAADGLEALAMIERERYDIVLTDIKMPGLDGPGLYREVGARRPELLPRFAFITGDLLNPATARFLEQAHAPCLRKPFGVDDLREVVRKVLGGR